MITLQNLTTLGETLYWANHYLPNTGQSSSPCVEKGKILRTADSLHICTVTPQDIVWSRRRLCSHFSFNFDDALPAARNGSSEFPSSCLRIDRTAVSAACGLLVVRFQGKGGGRQIVNRIGHVCHFKFRIHVLQRLEDTHVFLMDSNISPQYSIQYVVPVLLSCQSTGSGK